MIDQRLSGVMVAYGSPKPLVKVRILPDSPKVFLIVDNRGVIAYNEKHEQKLPTSSTPLFTQISTIWRSDIPPHLTIE